MTIADINKILSQLAANPTRENVLDLSFALLQWMNIEANKDPDKIGTGKPQLLSPQTQKLKDFWPGTANRTTTTVSHQCRQPEHQGSLCCIEKTEERNHQPVGGQRPRTYQLSGFHQGNCSCPR
jgi:hypothetical protein